MAKKLKLTQYTYLSNKTNEFTFSEQNIIKFGFCANENLMKNVKLKTWHTNRKIKKIRFLHYSHYI